MRTRTPVVAALAALAVLLGACQPDEARGLRWEIDFADDALRARAVIVEGRILEGGCTSRSVRFSAEASRGTMPEAPPRLEPGRYGLEARARDEECVWFASACVEVDVPRGQDELVEITLEDASETAACAPSACDEGRCRAASDAGPSDAGSDGGTRPDGGCVADDECGECMACSDEGACVPDDGRACEVGGTAGTCRGAACCSGCWSGGTCVAGVGRTACGTAGIDCAVCNGATPFCDGACVGPSVAVDLSVAAASACAVTERGALWCWGSNASGQLGNGTSGAGTESTTPSRVGSATDWAAVATGENHVCALRVGGALWCWGDNEDGQIGTGDFVNIDVPARVDVPGVWTSVSGAYRGDHTCLLQGDGSGWCMGQNDYGQLGLGDVVRRTAPTRIPDGTGPVISAGHHSTCAIGDDGSLWCWGRNQRGQLGLGTMVDVNTPQRVGVAAGWTAVSSGDAHTCGVRAGELYCWGYNSDAQLGIGSVTSALAPTRVGTATTWRDVSAALAHTCATRTDGTLWCWGKNDAGQLGLGSSSTVDETAPRQVGTATDWERVGAGDAFTCGLRDDSVYCWGASTQGQLAQGDRLSRPNPTIVTLPR